MMQINEAKGALDQLLQRCSKPFGFVRTAPLTYVRMSGTIEAFLLFGIRKDPRGYFAATGSIGLHLCELDQLLEGSQTNRIHINYPIHMLSEDRSFREWIFAEESKLDDLAIDIGSVIARQVIPFLDANGNLERVCNRLSSAAPKDWYVLPPEQKDTLLASIQWVLGDKAAAVATIDVALSKLVDAMPKKRVCLELLRSKLSI